MDVVTIYKRNEDIVGESEQDDIWDDELLIKAYNKSVKGIKQKIAERIGLCNGNDELEEDGKSSGCKGEPKTHSKKKWKVGDSCRAVYSVDGQEYEAQIVEVLSNGKCVVKYCGYNNLETVKIKSLHNSWGAKSRMAQSYASSESCYNNESKASEDSNEKLHSFTMPTIRGVPAIPPPPAFSLTSQFSHGDESAALSAMLMSWYMSGYHTGYYQGLLEGKKRYKKCSPDKKP